MGPVVGGVFAAKSDCPSAGKFSSTFRIFGWAKGSAEHPEDILVRNEVEGLVDRQNGATEGTGCRPPLLPG